MFKIKHRLTWEELGAVLIEAQKGHEEATEQIFAFLRTRLLAIARYRVPEVAEDTVQETLVIVHNRLPEFEALEGLLAFANQVLRNKIGNIYQGRERQKNKQLDMEGVAEPQYQINDDLQAVELDRILRNSIHKLGEKRPTCKAILSCLYDGFDTSEISVTLGIPKSRLKVSTFRCREALREILVQEYGMQV